jgi:hypothetical protein
MGNMFSNSSSYECVKDYSHGYMTMLYTLKNMQNLLDTYKGTQLSMSDAYSMTVKLDPESDVWGSEGVNALSECLGQAGVSTLAIDIYNLIIKYNKLLIEVLVQSDVNVSKAKRSSAAEEIKAAISGYVEALDNVLTIAYTPSPMEQLNPFFQQ